MLDLQKNDSTDRQIVEDCLASYMPQIALASINKDPEDADYDVAGWVDMLDKASVAPLANLPTERIKRIAGLLQRVVLEVFRNSSPATTYKELALATAMLVVYLAQDRKIRYDTCQGVNVSALIVHDALEHKDWGDIGKCKDASVTMRKYLNSLNLFV